MNEKTRNIVIAVLIATIFVIAVVIIYNRFNTPDSVKAKIETKVAEYQIIIEACSKATEEDEIEECNEQFTKIAEDLKEFNEELDRLNKIEKEGVENKQKTNSNATTTSTTTATTSEVMSI